MLENRQSPKRQAADEEHAEAENSAHDGHPQQKPRQRANIDPGHCGGQQLGVAATDQTEVEDDHADDQCRHAEAELQHDHVETRRYRDGREQEADQEDDRNGVGNAIAHQIAAHGPGQGHRIGQQDDYLDYFRARHHAGHPPRRCPETRACRAPRRPMRPRMPEPPNGDPSEFERYEDAPTPTRPRQSLATGSLKRDGDVVAVATN